MNNIMPAKDGYHARCRRSASGAKIAFIGQKGIPTKQGGIEKHVEELSTRLAKAGFDVSVYCRPHYTEDKKTRNQNYKGVKIINLPSINTKHLDAITHTFFSSIHALFQNYDIIHYHGVGPSLLSFLPRIFCPRAKVMATFHCIDRRHQKWGVFARLMLSLGEWAACRFPHETIAVSQTIQKYCQYRYEKETAYIPNGVKVSNQKTQSQILQKFGLTKGGYILNVSRLVRHKGVHTLIEAYQKIHPRKKLVIVGSGANTDDYVSYLKQLAKNNKNIIFTGQQSGADLEALFQNAYLFVHPSEAEGLSIALLEALAYGTPVLISDIEENQEVVGDLGLQFKSKSAADLARQLEYATKHSVLIRRQARLAKRMVAQKYNWEDIVKQTVGLYNKTMNQENKKSRKQYWAASKV